MTLKEAYVIFFGAQYGKMKINESYIRSKLTEEIVKRQYRKLVKKYHPDLHNNDKEYESYLGIMKNIDIAYEVLKDFIIKNPYHDKRKNDGEKDKILYFMQDVDAIELKRLIPRYKKLAEYAKKVRIYEIRMRIYKDTEYYFNEIRNCCNIAELYDLYMEYYGIIKETKKELNSVNETYTKLQQKLDSGNYNAKSLITTLQEIAGEYYQHLDNPFLKEEIRQWEIHDKENDYITFKDHSSYVFNIRNIMSKLLHNSNRLIQVRVYEALAIALERAREEFDKEPDLIKKLEIYRKYVKIEDRLREKMISWSDIVQHFDTLSLASLSEEYVKSLEEGLKERLSEEDIELLIDDDKISASCKKEQKNRSSYRKKSSSFHKKKKNLFVKMRKENVENIKTICDINNLFLSQRRCVPFPDFKTSTSINDSDRTLITNYLANREILHGAQYECIKLYYEIFICYSYVVSGSDIGVDAKSIFYQALNNDVSAESVEQYYELLTKKYSILMNSYSEQGKGKFELSYQVVSATKRKIMEDINTKLDYARDYNIKVPEELQNIGNIDSLSVIDLYLLSEKIMNIIFPEHHTR